MDKESFLKEFIKRVWNEQDFNSVEIFVSPKYTVHLDTGDPWEGKTLNHAEFRERLKYSFSSFPDIHFDIQTMVSDGDYVAITWVMTGTNLGKIEKYPPTGKSIKTTGMTIYHFTDGKISGHTQVFDRTTVIRQLGF